MLKRDEMLAKADIVTERVKVPEWGGEVLARGLTGGERELWETVAYPGEGKAKEGLIRATMIVLSLVDESGNRVFKLEDAPAVATKSAAALERIYRVCRRLSFVDEADIEELRKN